MKTRNFVLTWVVAALFSAAAYAAGLEPAAKPTGADLWVQNQKGGYTVEYVSDGATVGLQFDVHDQNIKEGNYQCAPGLASSHAASCTLHADEGFLRVVVFSMTNALVPDGTLLRVDTAAGASKLRKAAAAGPTLQNVVLADIQAQNITPAHLQTGK